MWKVIWCLHVNIQLNASFWFFAYSSIIAIANAASLKALFKHVTSGMIEPNTDDVIREKVMNFLKDKVRNHVFDL